MHVSVRYALLLVVALIGAACGTDAQPPRAVGYPPSAVILFVKGDIFTCAFSFVS